MQLPSISASSESYIEYADHTDGAAAAWANSPLITPQQKMAVADVAAAVSSATSALIAARDARVGAERLSQKLEAQFSVFNLALNFRLLGAGDAVLNGPALRNREHPIYLMVFLNQHPGDIARSDAQQKLDTVQQIAGHIQALPDFDGKIAALAHLNAALTQSVQSKGDWDAQIKAQSLMDNAEQQARLVLRSALEQSYGKLRAAFPGQRAFVESFFPKRKRSESKKKAGEPKKSPA